MQAPQLSISGTRDYAGDDAVALQAARDAIGATLRRYAYEAINPPILESALPFLNRSGEDIRRQMYIFPDPAGQELCLRPELTIPVCRAYLRQLHGKDGARHAPARQARLSYFGPAFTYEAAGEGRSRQFYQAGAEYLGAPACEAADAEIFAAALDTLQAAGLTQTSVEIGDVEVRNAFIDQLPISDKSKTRIRRIALRNPNAAALAATAGTAAAVVEETNQFGELASLLAAAEPGKAELLIREVFALADVRHVGGRTPEEIVERLTSRTVQQAESISAELIQGVVALLNIRAAPEAAFNAIREHFCKFRIGAVDAVLERCDQRLRYIEAYRGGPMALQFNVGLRRGLEYYTGFLFEIYAKDMQQIGHVCGGGRYDNLLEGLGAIESIPAVGFGIGLDRLLLALQKTGARGIDEAPTDALVVAAGKTRHDQCIPAAAALRAAGWSIELDLSGRDEESALRYATRHKIRRIVFVSESELKKGQIRVRDLAAREDRVAALSSVAAEVKGGSAEPASRRK